MFYQSWKFHENRSSRFQEIACTKSVRKKTIKKIIKIVEKKPKNNSKVFRWRRKTLIMLAVAQDCADRKDCCFTWLVYNEKLFNKKYFALAFCFKYIRKCCLIHVYKKSWTGWPVCLHENKICESRVRYLTHIPNFHESQRNHCEFMCEQSCITIKWFI